MIKLVQVSLQRGSKMLLESADLITFQGQKIGIVGVNGAGKTSLFQLIRGEISALAGDVDIPKSLTWAYIRQVIPNTDMTAVDYAARGDEEYADLMDRLSRAEEQQDGMAIANIHGRLSEIDGYSLPNKAAKILVGLGFSQEQLAQGVNTFSGGWRMRLNLAQVLLSRADVLLLDEPTNHLDLEGIVWLEQWLKETPQSFFVISHDREFLDHVTSHIVHLHDQQLKLYTGNYSTFEKNYAEALRIQHAAFQKQKRVREHMQSFVDRFRAKATKAKQAQSRIRMLEKMEQIAPVRALSPFEFEFAETAPVGNPMIQIEHVNLGYETNVVLEQLTLNINNDSRIGLLGLNGAGKSTFIKAIAGDIKPLCGQININSKVKVGYFAQHQLDQLSADESPMWHLIHLDPKITERDARNFLGGFNFKGDRVFERVGNFSGGEKSRLVLALLVWQKPSLLLLDEPTNHLDMQMREALSDALQNFTGTLLVVSHDRYLLNSLVDEFWLVDSGSISRFDGSLTDYHKWLMKRMQELTKESSGKTKKEIKNNEEKIDCVRLEKNLEKLVSKLEKLMSKFEDESLYQPEKQAKLTSLTQEQKQLEKKIAEIEDQILDSLDN